jgi:hypothetical protein
MFEQLAFALLAVALAAPFLVPLLWSQLGQSRQDTAAVAQDEQRRQQVKPATGLGRAGRTIEGRITEYNFEYLMRGTSLNPSSDRALVFTSLIQGPR